MPEVAAPSIWEQVWAIGPRIAVMGAAFGVLWAVVTFYMGPLRPQSQIDLDDVKKQETSLASRVAVCESRLDQIPRAQDFSGWEAHLSRLDAVFEAQRDTVTQNKYDIKDLAAKYQALTTTPNRR